MVKGAYYLSVPYLVMLVPPDLWCQLSHQILPPFLFVMHASDYQAYAGVEVLSCIYTDSLPCLTALNSVRFLACDPDRKAWCLSWTFQVGVVS